jgi:quercetin dioxygenase-like cupin family protein
MAIPSSQALPLVDLVVPTPGGIASRILAKTGAGNITLFAFDGGQGLTEHTSPFEALLLVVEGRFTITIGGTPVDAAAGMLVQMPAGVPHAVEASEPSRMLLMMLK